MTAPHRPNQTQQLCEYKTTITSNVQCLQTTSTTINTQQTIFSKNQDSLCLISSSIHPDTISKLTFQDSCPIFNYKNIKKYIFSNLHYPTEAIEKGIEGNVFIHFHINKVGITDSIRIVTSVHPLLDTAALQLIQGMPRWKPILHRGEAQGFSYTIPIQFKLSE